MFEASPIGTDPLRLVQEACLETSYDSPRSVPFGRSRPRADATRGEQAPRCCELST